VLTFGSVTFDDVHAIMSRFLRNWPEERKIIIQSGWAGLSVEIGRPAIKVIGSVSHDQLFRHASCIIHHGGAGTTASALFSGKPQIIVPHIADQFFWGAEMKRLRVGSILDKKTWPEKLFAKVAKVEGKAKMRRRAARMGRERARGGRPRPRRAAAGRICRAAPDEVRGRTGDGQRARAGGGRRARLNGHCTFV